MFERGYRLAYLGPYKELPLKEAQRASIEWYQQWTQQNLPNFTALELSNSAPLMEAFGRGIINTYMLHKRTSLPGVFLALTNTSRVSKASANAFQEEIYLRKDFLQSSANFSVNTPLLQIDQFTGDKYEYGSMLQLFELLGAEEAYHLLHPELPRDDRPTLSQAEQDAKPIELAALLWQREYAGKYASLFSDTTRLSLWQRYNRAKEFVAKKRENK